MFTRAKKLAKKMGASFLFSGEVLNERPMSQHLRALTIIEKEADLEGKILRPLSARLLPETEVEKKGWIEREKLLDISGRSRSKQIQLARDFNLKDYPCPAGGCLLTDQKFAAKIKDLFKHQKQVTFKDISLLKIGRHFRYKRSKIIVGRDEAENKQLQKLRGPSDYCFEVTNYGSPITLLQGRKTKVAIKKAAALTLRYSDLPGEEAVVRFGKERMESSIVVSSLNSSEIEELRIQ